MDRFNSQTFREWEGHPLTALFRQYLRDFQADLGERWASGLLMAPESQQTAKILGEMASLKWADVAKFYGLEADETESGA